MSLPCWGCRTGQRSRSSRSTRTGWATTALLPGRSWDDAATQAAYYDQARRWLWNDQNGYVSGEEDILSYYFQPVEVDARAYAAEETERLQGLIDKELQKET